MSNQQLANELHRGHKQFSGKFKKRRVYSSFKPFTSQCCKMVRHTLKFCSKCCKIFKACLTILQRCEVKV